MLSRWIRATASTFKEYRVRFCPTFMISCSPCVYTVFARDHEIGTKPPKAVGRVYLHNTGDICINQWFRYKVLELGERSGS